MNPPLDGNAVVYCEGVFDTPNGKTAHGLVRFSARYHVTSVVDRHLAGRDAGEVLDGSPCGIPIAASIDEATAISAASGKPASHLVVGLAPDGGRLDPSSRGDLRRALEIGLNVDCGLHDFLGDDPDLAAIAARQGLKIRDIRKPPPREALHFFSGKIETVRALKLAVLGTDSAVGKRTTAWKIVQGLESRGFRTEMIGTGQTAWMQGARFGIVMDALPNDFVSGEIEHAVWRAWNEEHPDAIIIEGQGSLMNPAYPGGFEILAAGRPDAIVLQHAPARIDYDGFPGYRIHPLSRQVQVLELLGGRPVVAVAINHENLSLSQIPLICDALEKAVGLPAFDVLREGPENLVEILLPFLNGFHR